MNLATAERTYIIHTLEVYQREIAKEGNDQLITMAKFFAKYEIPVIIEKLKQMEAYENEKYIRNTRGCNGNHNREPQAWKKRIFD